MARLPDAQALGEGKLPQPRGGLIPGPSNAGLAELTAEKFATAGVSEFADQLAQAGQRIQKRRDAIEHVNNLGEYETFATEELRKTSLEQDLTKQEVLAGLGERLRQKKTELLSRGGLSADGMARLEADLERTRVTHSVQAAGLARVQESKKTAIMIGQDINTLASEYLSDMANPRKLGEVFGKLDQKLTSYAGALEPQEEIMYARNGRSLIVFGALSMLAETRPDAAEDVLRQTPGIEKILSPEHQASVLQKIGTARAAMNKPFKLGEGETQFDVRGNVIARGAPKKEPLQLKEVYDPNSPSKTRWVTEAEAVGQPGPEKKPLISNEETLQSAMAKGLAKVDAETVKDIETRESIASRSLGEIDRMEAATKSGKFETGVFSQPRVFIARLLEFTGLNREETSKIIGDAPTADTLDAASKRLAVEVADKLGRVTNMSLGFVEASLPNLTRTPEGNMILLEVMRRTAQREIQIGTIKDEYIQTYGVLRPPSGKSFFQRIRDLEESDPVITPELKQRIVEGGKAAPKSFKEIAPPEFKPPTGYDFLRLRDDGRIDIKRKKDGKIFTQDRGSE